MGFYADIYVIKKTRSKKLAIDFLNHFLPKRKESATEYLVPQYSGQTTHEFDVTPRGVWRKLPIPKHEWSEYRIMEDWDGDNQKNWTELENIRLSGGEIIIG